MDVSNILHFETTQFSCTSEDSRGSPLLGWTNTTYHFRRDMAILPLKKIEAFHDAAGDKNIQIRTQNDSRLGFLNSLYILTRNEATHRKKNQPNKQ